jgi:hypothetical protein
LVVCEALLEEEEDEEESKSVGFLRNSWHAILIA